MEGEKVQKEIVRMTKDILYDNDFADDGTPNNEAKTKAYMPDKRKIRISHKTIKAKIKKYNKDKPDDLKILLNKQERFYENADNTVNISVDDVSVKKQKEKRPKDKEKS